jgi:hypothetical protein
MSSALSIDRQRGPSLPSIYRYRQQRQIERRAEHPSPLPDDWSDGTRPLREIARALEKIFEDR